MPTPLSFNANWYLSQNPDVAAAIEAGASFNAFEHFSLYGRAENRSASPLFDPEQYLTNNPDVAEAVAQGLITAWDHFELFGGDEGRSPTPLFNEAFYLQQNPDVAAAIEQGIISSAAQHFALFGQSEPRAINPAINLGQYINANPDIAQAASNGLINAFDHLLQFGVNEGRNLGNGISLSDFNDDPGFTQSLSNGNPLPALMRVESVAPFIPTFERPAGWTPPTNNPIPVDFVPPVGSGLQLVVPPEVDVPGEVQLPPVFQQPPAPTPEPEPEPEPVPEPTPPPSNGGGGNVPPPPSAPTLSVDSEGDATGGEDLSAYDLSNVTGTLSLNADTILPTATGRLPAAVNAYYTTTGYSDPVVIYDPIPPEDSITIPGGPIQIPGYYTITLGSVDVSNVAFSHVKLLNLSANAQLLMKTEQYLAFSVNNAGVQGTQESITFTDSLNDVSGHQFIETYTLSDGGAFIKFDHGVDTSHVVNGGDGNDTVRISTNNNSNVTYDNNATSLEAYGGAGNDYLRGGKEADILVGGDGADFLNTQIGDVAAEGSLLFGGSKTEMSNGIYTESVDIDLSSVSAPFVTEQDTYMHNDYVSVFDHANVFEGSTANDTMVASTAKDVFLYQLGTLQGKDTIHQFNTSMDEVFAVARLEDVNGGFADLVFSTTGITDFSNITSVAQNDTIAINPESAGWSFDATSGELTFSKDGLVDFLGNNQSLDGFTLATGVQNMTINLVGIQEGQSTTASDFFGDWHNVT